MAVLWLINRGDPNYLLTGMILQEPAAVLQMIGQILAPGSECLTEG